MYITTTGLVLRETLYKESSKLLNVLTPERGRITVLAKGTRRKGSRTAASAQLLAYAELTLFEGKTGYTLTEARCLELFEGLRGDLPLLSLGSYFAEVLETLSQEDSHDPELLSLGLNALYALSRGLYPAAHIKAVFEWRAMSAAGFRPAVEGCAVCGREEPDRPRLDLVGGLLHCASCAVPGGTDAELCASSLAALRHVVEADPKRIFSFTLGETAAKSFAAAGEAYLLTQLDRGFKTLDFYRSII
ncbi:MAG: DNA repair protein RecO [Oscillospiraceae bacterium]|nr:DNA repair protein RecO [Oscillospiraceae bacterium]